MSLLNNEEGWKKGVGSIFKLKRGMLLSGSSHARKGNSISLKGTFLKMGEACTPISHGSCVHRSKEQVSYSKIT